MKLKDYLREKKVHFINEFSQKFKEDFGEEVEDGAGFTTSDFFYFGRVGNRKYVLKSALRFVLTSGDTYCVDVKLEEDLKINNDPEHKKYIDSKVTKMFDYIRNDITKNKLYPNLISETPNFFVFEFYDEQEWEKLTRLTKEDAAFINRWLYSEKDQIVTPFYNQMYEKIMRNKKTGELVAIDLASLEIRDKKIFTVYMRGDHRGNSDNLFLLKRVFTPWTFLKKVYEIDYPMDQTAYTKVF